MKKKEKIFYLFIKEKKKRCFFSFFIWEMINIWLILPVVICLSKRLSHASVSMNRQIIVLWDCEWLIKSAIIYSVDEVILRWITVGKLELIHAKENSELSKNAYIRYKSKKIKKKVNHNIYSRSYFLYWKMTNRSNFCPIILWTVM